MRSAVREESKQKLKIINDDVAQYRSIRSKILNLLQNKIKKMRLMHFSIKKGTLSDHFTDTLYDLAMDVGKIADETYQTSQDTQSTITKILVLVIVAALVFGLLFGIILAKQIDSRLQDVVGYLEILAEGDFSKEISQRSLADASEFGDVSRAVEKMKNNIKALLHNLMETAEHMAAASNNSPRAPSSRRRLPLR